MNELEIDDLEEALNAASEEQMEEFVHIWGLEGAIYNTPDGYIEEILDRVEIAVCARFVWEALPPDERQIFYQALSYSAREGLRREALQKKSKIPLARFGPALEYLLSCCLLYQKTEEMETPENGRGKQSEEVSVIYPFEEYLDTLYSVGHEIFMPRGDRSTKSLLDILMEMDEDILHDIYKNYTASWKKYRTNNDLTLMVASTLLELEEPLTHVKKLSDRARDLYQWLLQVGGRASIDDVRIYTRLKDFDLSDVLYELESSALAFDTLTKQDRILFIPHDMLAHLKSAGGAASEPEGVQEVAIIPEDFVPASIRQSEPVILYDMAFVVNAINLQTIEPTQVGRVPKRIATKIRAQLRGQIRPDFQYEDNYLEMLLEIAKENGLLRLSKSPLSEIKEHYEIGERMDWWSHLDLTGQCAYLLHHWKSSYRWEDLTGMRYRGWDPYSWRPMAGREVVLKHLSRYTPGRWYSITTLVQNIWDTDAFAMHPQQPYGRKFEQRKTQDTREKWEKSDGETYIGMLASTLHELGIVELGYDRSDALETKTQLNPQFFLLTELGQTALALMGDNPPPVKAVTRSLIVQPNFELLLLQPDMPTLYAILPFTQLTQASIASRLILSRTTISRAIEGGSTIEHIIKVLEDHSQKELPQNVLYSLHDWARLYKGVKLSQVILFEVSSEAVATELGATPKFKDLGLRQIAPCLFAMSSDVNLKQLKQSLEKEGIAVQVNGHIITPQNRHTVIFDMLR